MPRNDEYIDSILRNEEMGVEGGRYLGEWNGFGVYERRFSIDISGRTIGPAAVILFDGETERWSTVKEFIKCLPTLSPAGYDD